MSQAEFARAVNVSRSYVNAVVMGRRPVSQEMVTYLSDKHGIDATWLVGDGAVEAAAQPARELAAAAADLLTLAARIDSITSEVLAAQQSTQVHQDLHDLMDEVLSCGPSDRVTLVRRLLEAMREPPV